MCEHLKAKCYDSRKREQARWRRYRCLECGHRWTTIEVEVDTNGPGTRSMSVLKSKYGISQPQEDAITALIEAFVKPLL